MMALAASVRLARAAEAGATIELQRTLIKSLVLRVVLHLS